MYNQIIKLFSLDKLRGSAVYTVPPEPVLHSSEAVSRATTGDTWKINMNGCKVILTKNNVTKSHLIQG